MTSRMYRFKPPLTLMVASVAVPAQLLLSIGNPGPCGGGGLFSEFFEKLPFREAIYFTLFGVVWLGVGGFVVGLIWLGYAMFYRAREHSEVDPRAHLP